MSREKSPSQVEVTPIEHSWFGRLLAFTPPPVPPHPQPMPSPNIFSKIFVSWLSPIMYTGYNRALEFNDIYEIEDRYKCAKQMEDYQSLSAKYKANGSQSAHWKAILKINERWLWLDMAVTLGGNGATLGMSLVASNLIDEVSSIYGGKRDFRPAVGYAVGQTVLFTIYLLCTVWGAQIGAIYRQHLTATVTAAIYDKTLRLSTKGRSQFSTSQISSLVTTDVARIGVAAYYVAPLALFIPLIAAVIVVLIHFLGVSALAGIALVLVAMTAASIAGRFTSALRKQSLPFADQRVSIIRETVASMRTLKFYGWESSFQTLLAKIRSSEEACIKMIARINVSTSAFTEIVPSYAGLLSFAVLSVTGHSLSPSRAFPSLTLFNMIAPSLSIFAQAVVVFSDAYHCFKRLEVFFDADESTEPVYQPGEHLSLQAASFEWLPTLDSSNTYTFNQRLLSLLHIRKSSNRPGQAAHADIKSPFSITDINIEVQPGELVMVVGAIGSGKSSLLHAIAGHLSLSSGTFHLQGGITALLKNWSINGTVRENIIFGQKFDEERYTHVLKVCQLAQDLDLFESGDLTEVGENGITLSGGQKARLALARGVYGAREIVLLDDVLSAVDSKVSAAIMENCILGYIGDRTRIMTTHNLALLSYASQIVFMNSHHQAVVGTLTELMANDEFKSFYTVHEKRDTSDSMSTTSSTEESQESNVAASKPLMEEELRQRGVVNFDVIRKYVSAGSPLWVLLAVGIIGLVMLAATAQVMQSVFLNWWTADQFNRPSGFYIGVYAAVVSGQCIFQVGFMWVLSEFVFAATSGLYRRAISHVYNAPISFFDTTPFGRIVNRFTNDLTTLDTIWFNRLSNVFPAVSNMLGGLILIFVYAPWAALCLIPIVVVAVVGVNFYRSSSREINRIQSLHRSKMFSQLTESIEGCETIVGFGRAQHFRDLTFDSIEKTLVSSNVNISSMSWLAFRVLLTTVPIIFVVSMLCVFRIFNVTTSEVAMLISLVPTMSMEIVSVIINVVETEKNLSSVERLYEYAYLLPQEAATAAKAPPNWPQKGGIKFENLSFSYREGLPSVLRDFNLEVYPGEKVGICGRTGAGKSSLISCLFRLGELDGGRILIDDVDIAELEMNELRANLCIIPQESVLFKGTVRSNLDPFQQHDDTELWEALHRSGAVLDQAARDGKYRLEAPVDDNGNNYSLGERQLLSLSRALVKKSKIIALDEATANVDHKTDAQAQQIISKEFSDSTILCIAHRLQTIIGYDKIVVMDSGRVLEYGTPLELFLQNGVFRSLCRESDLDEQDLREAQQHSV